MSDKQETTDWGLRRVSTTSQLPALQAANSLKKSGLAQRQVMLVDKQLVFGKAALKHSTYTA
jgi:hypothetical protein